MVLSCGDWSRTSVCCCCLSGATPYTHSSPILTQLLHRGFFSQHWENRVSRGLQKELPRPRNPHFHFACLAHQAASARLAMALDAPPFLRRETLAIIAAVAPTLDRVVSGVLRWWRCVVHSARKDHMSLIDSRRRVAGLI